MFTLAARVEEKMDTSAIRSVSGTESAGRMLLSGNSILCPCIMKRAQGRDTGFEAFLYELKIGIEMLEFQHLY